MRLKGDEFEITVKSIREEDERQLSIMKSIELRLKKEQKKEAPK